MTRAASNARPAWRQVWPGLALAPLLVLVAWPSRRGASTSDDPALLPLRVAYPQVEVLDARRFDALRLRSLVVDAARQAPRTAAELSERLGSRAEGRAIVFRAPRAEAALALRAALQARVWGLEPCYAYLD